MIEQMPDVGGPEGGPEDFEVAGGQAPHVAGAKENLSEAWKTRPMFRLVLIVMPVVAIAAIGMGLFGGGNEANQSTLQSQAPAGNDIALNPATPTSPEVKQSVEQADIQKIDQALATGNSAIATPMRSDIGMVEVEGEADPLAEWRGSSDVATDYGMEPTLPQDTQARQQADTQEQQRRQQESDNLAKAMQAQMSALLKAWVPQGAKVTMVEDAKKAAEAAAAAASKPEAPKDEGILNTLVSAGDVVYAQVLTQANSDVPGPVLAEILTGKLKGARILGNFDYTEEYLVLNFQTAVLGERDYRIEAIALDPDTTLTGVATDVDNHYFKRIVLPAAGAFISGFAASRADTGSSSTTTSGGQVVQDKPKANDEEQVYKGISSAADKVSEFLDKAGDVKPTVVIASRTPVGILFLKSVREMTK